MLQEGWNSSTISIVSTLQLHALVAHVLSLAAPVYSRRNAVRRIRWSSQTLCAVMLSCVNTSHSAPSLPSQVDVVYRSNTHLGCLLFLEAFWQRVLIQSHQTNSNWRGVRGLWLSREAVSDLRTVHAMAWPISGGTALPISALRAS